jgi:hypothetical protein
LALIGSAYLADFPAPPVAPLARVFALDPQPDFARVIKRDIGGDDPWGNPF